MTHDTPDHPPDAVPQTARRATRIVFFTLFLDIIGFSIIFPLFPSLLDHYLHAPDVSPVLASLLSAIHAFQSRVGMDNASTVVLFGGLLGAVYSLLQFVFAPILGGLSDRYGRRPVLIACIAGTVLSHLMWVCAGSFELFALSRVLGGVMSGSITTASAAIADVTPERGRSRGMALIGIAFGLGMTLGPLLGISAAFDITELRPEWTAWGVNPFSAPAALAAALALANLAFLWFRFPETLPPGAEPAAASARTANPLRLFRRHPSPGVTATVMANFAFTAALAGVEFSLTFLAAERFGFGPARNGAMLAFVGVCLALVQGGYVRRMAARVGSARMARRGLLVLAPALVLIGFAPAPWALYVGLLLFAIGSAQTMPCLMGLVSVYAPPDEQGQVLGVFRSLGALARAVGPLTGCTLYWIWGPEMTYLAGATVLAVPLWLIRRLPSETDAATDPAPQRLPRPPQSTTIGG